MTREKVIALLDDLLGSIEDRKGGMTIAEKVLEDNEDCNIFVVMDNECPSDYGFHDCDCHMGQKACLKCWTREIEKE